jgi:hypothetical protein
MNGMVRGNLQGGVLGNRGRGRGLGRRLRVVRKGI